MPNKYDVIIMEGSPFRDTRTIKRDGPSDDKGRSIDVFAL